MMRTEKVMMMDRSVLNFIPFNVLPDISNFKNWIIDDIFAPFDALWRHIISEKIKRQERNCCGENSYAKGETVRVALVWLNYQN